MPEEIIDEILVKLPVKSVLRFKCVSKSWCSIITSHGFMLNHLRNCEKEENGSLLVYNINFDAQRYSFAMYPDKTLTVPVFEYLDVNMKTKAHLLGPCKGIFCIENLFHNLALWNPATREIRTLSVPHLSITYRSFIEAHKHVFGFGFDPVTNDHKVVSIEMVWMESEMRDIIHFPSPMACHRKRVSIYSMRDDSWREFTGNFPKCYVCYSWARAPYVEGSLYPYIDGVYYWCAKDDNDRPVYLSFHMSDEVFQLIPEMGGRPDRGMYLGPWGGLVSDWDDLVGSRFGVYNNSLAWIESYPCGCDVPNVFNVWVLKEGAWTKEVLGPFAGATLPLGFWKTGELLVLDTEQSLFVANPNTLEMKDLGTVAREAFVYHESLISVKRRGEELENSTAKFLDAWYPERWDDDSSSDED